jgi:hypothetical protein
MSSTLSVISKSLAPALAIPETKIHEWLQVIVYRACEELLLSGSVHLPGIGMLRKAHVASRPAEQNGEMWLLPPRCTVEILPESDDSSGGLLYDEALDTLGLDDEMAEKFAMGFATAVQKTLEFKGQLELEPLGVLTLVGKDLTIQPSEWLLDLLNKPYQELVAISLSEKWPNQIASEQPALTKQESQTASASSADLPAVETESSTTTAQLVSPVPPVQRVELNPSDFGLDSEVLPQQDENKIFIEQSGLLADLNIKRPKPKKKKFQPPIPIYSEEIDKILSSNTQKSTADSATPSAVASEPTPLQTPAPPPKVPRKGISKATVITLIIVGISVVAIIAVFFLVSQSLRTFPTSSTASKSPAATTTEAKKTVAEQDTELLSQASGKEKQQTAKQSESTENPKANKPDGTKLTFPTPTNPKDAAPSATRARPSDIIVDLPPELSTPVVEAKGGWCIVVASRPNEAEALEVAKVFAQKGFSVSVKPRIVNGEQRYRVRIGQFAQQQDALKAIKQYTAYLPKGAFLDKVQ